jgi:transposase, IS30 family
MRTYKQLTYEQRCQIEALKKSGVSQQKIADLLKVSQSSISRELARNRGERGYRHNQAQQKSVARRQATVKPHKMTPELINEIEDKLWQKWSPEQISGWLLMNQDICISHESIYRHIWADKKADGDLYKNLRRHARKYKARGSHGKTRSGQIKNRVSIDDRPMVVDEKSRVGDWEIDTVIGKGHSGGLVTIVERATLFTVSMQVNSKRAEEVTAATLALLTPFKGLVHTITSDNGKEFAYHEQIAEGLGCDFYFANAYSSWQRGVNENTNGLLRQYFPKCTDFKTVTACAVKNAVDELNNRPRKTLEFKTPTVLMQEKMAALVA